jgi:hypothetical protein
MCKLIATEELWLLLDALQEPVPEEVHQHLENINTSTTPLLSPGSISIRTAAVVATAPPTTNSAEEEEQTKCKTPSLLVAPTSSCKLNSLRFQLEKEENERGGWLVKGFTAYTMQLLTNIKVSFCLRIRYPGVQLRTPA